MRSPFAVPIFQAGDDFHDRLPALAVSGAQVQPTALPQAATLNISRGPPSQARSHRSRCSTSPATYLFHAIAIIFCGYDLLSCLCLSKHTPFMRASAMKSSSNSCSPAPLMLVLRKPISEKVLLSGGVFLLFADTVMVCFISPAVLFVWRCVSSRRRGTDRAEKARPPTHLHAHVPVCPRTRIPTYPHTYVLTRS